MANRTVSEELVSRLAEIGVKQIFGITGDALNPFTDAIRRHGGIQWLTVRHEESAAFAACAQAELTGKLAVCAGTVGPGALHLLNGLYNAKRDRVPVLAITGQVSREETGRGYFQELSQLKTFDDVCVFNETLRSRAQIPDLLHSAITKAMSERGVAHIAIPTDLANEKINGNVFNCLNITKPPVLTPSMDAIEQAATLINAAKRVGILIGSGASGSEAELTALAENLKAPIVHTLKATDILPHDHTYSIGGIGHVGTPHGLTVLDKSELLLMLGTHFPYREFLPTHGNIIQIDREASHLGDRCPIKLGLQGDVRATLALLNPKLQEKTDTQFLSALQQRKTKWQQTVDKKYLKDNGDELIHPQSVVLKVSELAAEDAIFCADIGEISVWIARHLRIKNKQRLISSFNHGSLGVGLPAAIGAKAHFPDRQVISLNGDGGFCMLMNDLITASRYKLPIVFIVFNNEKFGFVELEMEASGLPRYATDLVNPDFAKIAEANGGYGATITRFAELEPALKTALTADRFTVLDIKVNPHELITPPNIDPKVAWKFMQGKIKEVVVEKNIKVLFER